jgi:hypothetical protein
MTMPSSGREPLQDEQRLEARRAGASRDAGLRRVSRLTGLAVAVAIGLTGVLSEVVAHAKPGRSKHAAAATSRAAPESTTPAAPAAPDPQPSDQQPSNPQPPEQAPAPSTASGGAVSGGS